VVDRELRRDSFSLIREELRWRVAVVLAILISLLMALLGIVNTRLSTPDTALLAWAVLCICLACVVMLFRLPKDRGATLFFITIAVILVAVLAYGMAFERAMQHWAYIFPPVLAFLLRSRPALAGMVLFGIYAVVMISPNAAAVDVVRFASGYGLLVCFMYTYALLQEKAGVLLRHHSDHDALSNCLNRRTFNEAMEQLSSGRMGVASCTFLLLDIDHFKAINDQHGHLVGDRVITGVATALARALRAGTLLFRYGGEEFAVLLPGAKPEEGMLVAERLRLAVASGEFEGITVTVSIGVSQWRRGDGSVPAALERADRALYEAKRAGRNRTVLAPPDSPATP